MTIIPGVELSADVTEGEIHILGYLDSYEDPGFQAEMDRFREGRVGRAEGMVKKLGAIGLEIDWERVKEIAGDGAIGRPPVAKHGERVRKSVQEAFGPYIAGMDLQVEGS